MQLQGRGCRLAVRDIWREKEGKEKQGRRDAGEFFLVLSGERDYFSEDPVVVREGVPSPPWRIGFEAVWGSKFPRE